MLVLSRRTKERVVIGDAITIEVISNEPGRVRLGIVAPRDVRVDREEIATARGWSPCLDTRFNVREDPPRRPAA